MFYHGDLARTAPSVAECGESNDRDRDRGNALLRNALRALPLLALGTLLEGCAAPSSPPALGPDGSASNPFIGGLEKFITGTGANNNWVSYARYTGTEGSDVGITLDLRETGKQEEAGGDTLSEIENVIGSPKNDTLTGSANANTLRGAKGDDELDGGAGADTLDGGEGADMLDGGAGNDVYLFVAGDGNDRIVDSAGDNELSFFDMASFFTFVRESNDLKITVKISGSKVNEVTIVDYYVNYYDPDVTPNASLSISAGGMAVTLPNVGSEAAPFFATNVAESFSGGTDTDWLSFAGDKDTGATGVTVNLLLTALQVQVSVENDFADGDTYTGINNLIGTGRDDTFTGNTAANVLDGRAGADTLDGGKGADTLDGGVGVDTYRFFVGDSTGKGDTISDSGNGGASATSEINQIQFIGSEYRLGSFKFAISGEDLVITITTRTNPTDTVTATVAESTGGTRYEIKYGVVVANTTLVNLIYGTTGADDGGSTLTGEARDDYIFGRAGNDTLDGGAGSDTLIGGAGDDTLDGGVGLGADTLIGGAGADTLDGEAGTNDTASYASYKVENFDNDTKGVTVDLSKNVIGGDGNDKDFILVVDTNRGSDAHGDRLINIENLTGTDYIDVLTGDSGENILEGGEGDDTLDGGAEYDVLEGGKGDDTLIGGVDGDTLDGGAGVDIYRFSVGDSTGQGDTIDDAGTDSNDELQFIGTEYSADSFAFKAIGFGTMDNALEITIKTVKDSTNYTETVVIKDFISITRYVIKYGATGKENTVANLRYGTGGDDGLSLLTGTTGNDYIFGRAGDDTLDGGEGADKLYGGEGDETGGDTASYANYERVTAGTDGVAVDLSLGTVAQETTFDFNSNSDKTDNGHAAGDKLFDIENLRGSKYNDFLTGDGGENILEGGEGADTLDGGEGEDWASYENYARTDGGTVGVTVDLGKDPVDDVDDPDDGYIVVVDTRNTGSDAHGDRLKGIENLRGSRYDDTLIGDGENNVLEGGKGIDTLEGGEGDDTYIFRAGDGGTDSTYDTVDDNGGGGTNTIRLVSGTDIGSIYSESSFSYSPSKVGIFFFAHIGNTLVNAVKLVHSSSLSEYGFEFTRTPTGEAEKINIVLGTFMDDLNVEGTDGFDLIYGAVGDDKLIGKEGNDTLDGGYGADTLEGGAGNDNYVFNRQSGNATNRDTITDDAGTSLSDVNTVRFIDTAEFTDYGAATTTANTANALVFSKSTDGNHLVIRATDGVGNTDVNVMITDYFKTDTSDDAFTISYGGSAGAGTIVDVTGAVADGGLGLT